MATSGRPILVMYSFLSRTSLMVKEKLALAAQNLGFLHLDLMFFFHFVNRDFFRAPAASCAPPATSRTPRAILGEDAAMMKVTKPPHVSESPHHTKGTETVCWITVWILLGLVCLTIVILLAKIAG